MFGEPFGDCFGFPVGENIDRAVRLHIDQNRAVPMSFPQREVIDTEHLDSGRGRIR